MAATTTMQRSRAKTNTMKALDLLCINEHVHYDGMVQIEAEIHGARPGAAEIVAASSLMCAANVKATRKEHPLWARPMKQIMELTLETDNLVLRAPSLRERGDGSELILTVNVTKMGCTAAVGNIVFVVCRRGNSHDNRFTAHAFRLAKTKDAALLAEALDAVCARFFGSHSPPRDRRPLSSGALGDEAASSAPAHLAQSSSSSSAAASAAASSAASPSPPSSNSSTKSSRSLSETDEAPGPYPTNRLARSGLIFRDDSTQPSISSTDGAPSVREAKSTAKPVPASTATKGAVASDSWFHGLISREEAEDRIDGNKVGTFLVRVSQSSVGYAITVVDITKQVRHFRVIIDEGDKALYLDGHQKYRFKTLPELVAHYHTFPLTIENDFLVAALNAVSI